ncbi:MAG: amidohydrolase family protein [Gemmatimonadota bacterium]|nr:amidohydrolase family protein [Gemmatimonadota bacterium]
MTHLLERAACLAALTAAAALPLRAQLGTFNPRPGAQGIYAIKNARIVTGTGTDIANGTLVISGGRIVGVGANAAIPAGAQTIDATGLIVYPGMIDGGTTLGLNEIPQGANATVDVNEVGSFNPNVQAFYGINPHSAHVGVTRVVGVTTVVSRPTGGIISGQAALLNLAGDTPPQMAITPKLAMVIELPRSGFTGRGFAQALAQQGGNTADAGRARQRQVDSLKQMLHDADAYGKAFDAYAKDKTLPRPEHDVVLASLVPALRGEMPVIFPADAAADIRAAVTFAEEMHLKPIIIGGRDAAAVAPFLKQHNVPVVITSVMDLPAREDDPYDANYSTPAKLLQAGVKFAISQGENSADSRNLPYVAGMAAANGLPKDEALKSVTLYPAQIFGVGDRLGTIEVGKMANIVITTGDMLEAKTDTKYLFIDGRPIPLGTKHTELNTMFKDRP